ncbi:hypothetical protein [Lysobacter auxotrophicus]|uniref:Secreted protein n=1 Tax=Lysobacter auxotrophicus TaxID=2992573 RepID=A0ABM8DB99_9GAMM|nr:hypothetical protein [Lysobacter auxotrophicus]BDU15843.1 hypothetical protein LA521A_10440 [Lysobacter auxotrophicus]
MKSAFLSVALLLALATLSPDAGAQTPYVSIEERLTPEQLRSVGLTGEQLDKLNRLLRQAQDGASVATPVSAAPVARTANPVQPPAARDERGRDEASLIGFNDKPIQSRLKGSISGWEPGTVFELENGQQWKVLKGALKLPRTLDAPGIVVVPGVAGRWFLQVVDGMPKARVYRID